MPCFRKPVSTRALQHKQSCNTYIHVTGCLAFCSSPLFHISLIRIKISSSQCHDKSTFACICIFIDLPGMRYKYLGIWLASARYRPELCLLRPTPESYFLGLEIV